MILSELSVYVYLLTDGRVGQDERESLQKEITDLRRSLGEESYEKEVVQKTANDLRNSVKKLESEKIENGRVIHDLRQRIARACVLIASAAVSFIYHVLD